MDSYATFVVDDLYLGVPVTDVQEVLRGQAPTPVPLAAPEVGGLVNLRGQIVLAVDLRRRLGLPERGSARPSMHLVLARPDGPVSLLVDAVEDVVDVTAEDTEPPPVTLPRPLQDLVTFACKLPNRLLLVLDSARAVQAAAPTAA